MDLTTRDIERKTAVEYVTLRNWIKRGWLSEPSIVHYGMNHGRGSRLIWNKVVVDQVKQIQTYKKMGNSLEQIDDILKESKL